MAFKELDVVRITKLFHPPGHYDGWSINKRSPRVGDVGTIVDIQNAPNLPTNYVVEASSPNGIPDWLGDFFEEELELVS